MKSKTFLKFNLNDLIIIAVIAALATAVKVVSGEIIRSFTSSIGIPGGAVAGGFYMMWLALGVGIVGKRGTATLVSLIQALLVFSGGLPGSHGILTLITYIIPGIAVDVIFAFNRKGVYTLLHFLFATMLANVMGTIGTNLIFFRLPFIPLLFTLISAMLSGSFGGVIGYYIWQNLKISKDKKEQLNKLKIKLNNEKQKEEGELND